MWHGLYSTDPREPEVLVMIKTVENITSELKDSLTGKKRETGGGGIQSNISGRNCNQSGIPVVIVNSRRENVIPDILSGKEVGNVTSSLKVS